MIAGCVVAVVVFGVGLIIRGVPRPARGTGGASVGDVAVLFVARDRADRIGEAVASARRLGAAVFVVSDRSADATGELACAQGAEVVETLRPLGPGRSLLAGLRSFRLAERYAFVLVLDVDVRLEPSYLAATLPVFGDAGVAAVDARVAGSGLAGSYLARTYAVPGVARLYRTAVLERPDLDARIVLSPGPPATVPPAAARERRATARWAELAGALIVLAVLVAAVVSAVLGLDPWYLLAGFLVGDYLLTIAVMRRLPVVALVFPLLRVVDAVDALRGVVLALVAIAAVVRVAVATTTLPASPAEQALADAGYRTVAGYADTALPAPLAVTGAHLDLYALVTDPFGRHLDVLTGARELAVIAAVVVVAGLIAIATILRVHPLLTAAVLVAVAAPGPVVAVFGAVGPGVVAVGWLVFAVAVLVARRRDEDWQPDLDASGVFGVVALLVALATVPILVVPLAIGVVVWLGHTSWRRSAAILAGTGCVVAALWATGLLLAPTGPVVGHRTSLLVALTAVAVAGLAVPKAWPAAAGTLTALGLAFWFGPDADALLPATVVGAVLTGVLVLDAMLARRAAVITAAVAVTATVAGLLVVPPVAPKVDHAALAAWVAHELDDGVTIAVPAAVWADLHRDFARLGNPDVVREDGAGSLVVTTGREDGTVLGRFGTLTLLATDFDRTYLDPAERAAAGRQLATNSRLLAGEPVRAALRAGQVDLRVMAVLAALCAEHEVSVVATGNPPAERGTGLPDRTVVIAAVDGRRSAQPLLDWLRTQRAPFAPADTRATPDGFAISWRLPDVLDRATR